MPSAITAITARLWGAAGGLGWRRFRGVLETAATATARAGLSSSSESSQSRASTSSPKDAGDFTWSELKSVKYNSYNNRMSRKDRKKVKQMLQWLRTSEKIEADALRHLYVTRASFPRSIATFARLFLGHLTEDLKNHLIELYPYKPAIRSVLFRLYGEYVTSQTSDAMLVKHSALAHHSDMRESHLWYPAARLMNRKLVYHVGPTNSGKTYQALKRLVESPTGTYCAPLRLLAAECYDAMNSQGAITNLVTGQEMKESPFATHSSCTVEMADLTREVDLAVIDEIQMIADPERGYAWTRALMGVPAREIHLCGDDSVLDLIKKLSKRLGEPLEVRKYARHKPLVVEKEPLEDFKSIRPGDCLICFSKREVLELKLRVERETNHKCSVIYGSLPPETRRQQAQLFNDQGSDYEILAATDAVGMGVNLTNVRRIIFTAIEKYTSVTNSKTTLSSSQIKQIAGRAGRRSSQYERGLVTAVDGGDLETIRELMGSDLKKHDLAGILPPYEQIEMFASLHPPDFVQNFGRLIRAFVSAAQVEGESYFICRTKDLERMGGLLTKYTSLSLEEKYTFAIAPIDTSNREMVLAMLNLVEDFAGGKGVRLHLRLSRRTDGLEHLERAELAYKIASLYLWLALRFPDKRNHESSSVQPSPFVDKDKAEIMLKRCTANIEKALETISIPAKAKTKAAHKSRRGKRR